MTNNYVSIYFIYPNKSQIKVIASVGDNLLEAAHKYGIKIKANCGGKCSCTTCHVYVEESYFVQISELYDIEDKELDKLETNSAIEYNSRLSCQITVTKSMHNMKVYISDDSYGEHEH